MRLDKYLKLSRLIKRRTLAKEAALKEKILINNVLAKPSSNVKINDILSLYLGNKIIIVRITSLELIKDGLMYELIEEKFNK